MKVISYKNLPSNLPIAKTTTFWLLLDRLHVPSWAWGVFYTLVAIVWVVCIWLVIKQEYVELSEQEYVELLELEDETK